MCVCVLRDPLKWPSAGLALPRWSEPTPRSPHTDATMQPFCRAAKARLAKGWPAEHGTAAAHRERERGKNRDEKKGERVGKRE